MEESKLNTTIIHIEEQKPVVANLWSLLRQKAEYIAPRNPKETRAKGPFLLNAEQNQILEPLVFQQDNMLQDWHRPLYAANLFL